MGRFMDSREIDDYFELCHLHKVKPRYTAGYHPEVPCPDHYQELKKKDKEVMNSNSNILNNTLDLLTGLVAQMQKHNLVDKIDMPSFLNQCREWIKLHGGKERYKHIMSRSEKERIRDEILGNLTDEQLTILKEIGLE